ncbi:hypothetical protein ACFQGE_00385 [Halomicroarcula sp. GCM10025817]|uniref:hypothetical protein n=1 Tax=Haloarcula TaxID=2237 RepID=UPI0023E78F9E|nr:hypothetical protein [Halomicroarcula sp. SYNS111]
MARPTATLPSGDGPPVVSLGTWNGDETVANAVQAGLGRGGAEENHRRIDDSAR